MNVHWQGAGASFPIVEFHNVRTENGMADSYLAIETGLAAPLVALGAAFLGQFRVRNHVDRLITLRGFASAQARREALTAFHAGEAWAACRRDMADLTRSTDTILSRAIAPLTGPPRMRPGESYQIIVSELRFAEQIGSYHLWLRLFLRKAGLDPVASFATLESVNDVPAVPVVRNRTQHLALMRLHGRVPDLPSELRGMLRFPVEMLELEPAMALV